MNAWLRLRNAIYQRATKDYETALKKNNKGKADAIRKWILSTEYGISDGVCEAIVKGVEEKVEKWRAKNGLKTESNST